MSLNDLTYLQKTALEGEVARIVTTSRHDGEILLRLYTILKNAPTEICFDIVEIVKSLTSVKEELLNKVILEVSSDKIPLWVWTNKVIGDIKIALKMAHSEASISEASVHKKEAQEKIIKSAFILYCRQVAMLSPSTARQLCLDILKEDSGKLDFLNDCCLVLLEDIKELRIKEKKNIIEQIILSSIDIQNILSYKLETEVISNINKSKKPKKDKIENKEIKEEEVISKIIEESFNKPKKENNVKYSVIKYYTDCGVSTTLRSFKTEEEAEEFMQLVIKQFPDIQKTCKLYIEKLEGKRR